MHGAASARQSRRSPPCSAPYASNSPADRGHGRAIAGQLREGDFKVLVAGALRNPSWLEPLVGGTTTGVLRTSPVPVLIEH